MMVKTERKAMGKSNKIKNTDRNGILSVSYTHLTLPTNREV